MKGKQTLAKEVKKARFDLGFQTRVSFANHIGMSTRIVGEIENARRVLRGEFGNGRERKARLGYLYPAVQERVNQLVRMR